MVRIITYAMYVCSEFYFFQFSEKWKEYIFVVIAFFYIFVFRYLRKKVNNLEIVDLFTRQKKFIMLPDVTHSRTYNDAVV